MSRIVDIEGLEMTIPAVRHDKPLQATSATPSDLLKLAVEQGADLDRLERLMALQERWEANQARRAFVEAMTAFKSDPPEIFKTKQVRFENKAGNVTEYKHATLGDVCQAVIEGLARNGLSHSWDTQQAEGGLIAVTCIITHAQGHSERTTLKAGRDESGGKNSIQAIASSVTYLQRYTLLTACGLATKDEADDDGRKSEAPAPMTLDHQATVQAKCEELSPTMIKTVLKSYKADDLSQIPDSEYETIITKLENTRKKREQK